MRLKILITIAAAACLIAFLQAAHPAPDQNFAKVRRSLVIQIEPQQAAAAGGAFSAKRDGPWQAGGSTLELECIHPNDWPSYLQECLRKGIKPTQCSPSALYLKPLPDWDEGTTHEVKSPLTYKRATGTMSIVIKPDELARGGAQWGVDTVDAPWRRSGEVTIVATGAYRLVFRGIDQAVWRMPASEEYRVTKNTMTQRIVTFTRK